MRKILSDKSFWLILGISIISLVVLTVSVVFLTKQNAKEFYSAGYIIDSSATKSDKYYFNDETVYKENVFDEYVFTDVDNNEVSTSKDNFIHYLDNSLSFMKNGVILDLDNFNESIVPYYNITDKSVVKYNNGGYYVEAADKTLVFGNFLGRITDNKYIVVGSDVSVKLAGNSESVKGDYFEILFVENGIVKIENQEGSYQTVSDGTVIYVGDDIEINLGDKSVVFGDETKLSLTEMTIDGNENIDIVTDGVVDTDDGSGGGSGGSGNGDGNGTGTGDGTGTGTGDGEGTGTGDGNGTGEGDGTQIDGETTTVLKKEVSVNLISASTDVNTIKATFQVIDTVQAINGNLVLNLVNTTTGKTVYTKILANVIDEQSVIITSLASDCNYVMTITADNNESSVQYFQKSFRTDSLDLKLKRELVTEDSLTYSLDFGNNNDIVAADITLFDENDNEIESYTVYNETDNSVTFHGRTSNTLYKAVVDNVVINNVQYEDVYKSTTTDMTLKVKPTLGNVSVKTDNNAKTFTLSMEEPVDEDNAIVKYTYEIYYVGDLTEDTMVTAEPELVYTFSSTELEDKILKLDAAKELYGNTNYRFKVAVLYFDNYRYNEIETEFSEIFNVEGKATISFEEEQIDFDRISGTVVIDDTDCTIPFEDRECFNQKNNFSIRYYGGGSTNRTAIENVDVDSEKQTLYFDLDGLQENTLYTFEVYADVDLKDGNGLQESVYIGGFNVSTTGISALKMQNWSNNSYSYEVPISVSTEMVSTSTENSSIDKLNTITFNLYSGELNSNVIDYSTPIASYTVTEDVKEQYYNKIFSINSNSFEYRKDVTSEDGSVSSEIFNIDNLEVLKELSGGRLSKCYTIEVTAAITDETGIYEFTFVSDSNIYHYYTPAILLLEDEVSTPEVVVEEITNIQAKSNEYEDYNISNVSDLSDEIVVGYKVTAIFDKAKIENFAGYGAISSINFYVNDSHGRLIEEKIIDYVDSEEYTVYFPVGQGTDYATIDKEIRRGNTYKFSFDLNIDDDSDPATDDLVFPSSRPTSEKVTPVKQNPSFKLYIDNSTNNSITYKYRVYDYDNALYKEEDKYYMYYSYEGAEEGLKTEFVKDESLDTFTLNGLSNSNIYIISYYSAINKDSKPMLVNIGSYYFDGYYDGNDYNLGYKLEYGNFDNRLKIVIDDNEFLNRVSAYLLTLEADGEKYQTVVTSLTKCDDKAVVEEGENPNKCIIVDYADIVSFKSKDIKVTLDAFYDTGYVGFSQSSKLGSYFESLGLVDSKNASKVGFIYQTTGTSGAGEYFYVDNTGYSSLSSTPNGVLGYELVSTGNFKEIWKLSTSNMINISDNKFVSYGKIAFNNSNVISTSGSINIIDKAITVNPKVLDKVTVQTDDDNFKFTSITPKVSTVVKSLINGATMNINLSIDASTLETDFVKTDDKYKFYVDLYQKTTCPEVTDGEESDCTEELYLVKTVETDYDSLSEVTFTGLDPDTKYYYKISADMNKNGEKIKTPLFDYNRTGYVEFFSDFSTLNKNQIFNRVTYSYNSTISDERYNNRELTITSILKTNVNFDVKFELYDINGVLEFEGTINNQDIVVDGSNITAKLIKDITGDDFVFGVGYHNLVITAITTDLHKELELYNDMLIDDSLNGKNFDELDIPTFVLSNSAEVDSISSTITVTDPDKVIKDGVYYIELQDSAYNNACPGHEDDCKATVKIKKTGSTCSFDSGKLCNIKGQDANSQIVNIVFDGLKSDTNYSIYVYANTYRNNYNLLEKDELVYVRKNQYTKSELDFSLGAVTPVAATKNQVDISFVSSANLEEYLVGIRYTINIDGGETVKSGTFGYTPTFEENDVKLQFNKSTNTDYPTITITTDKELGTNNYIIMEYYYKEKNGNIKQLVINGNTSYQYTVKNKS